MLPPQEQTARGANGSCCRGRGDAAATTTGSGDHGESLRAQLRDLLLLEGLLTHCAELLPLMHPPLPARASRQAGRLGQAAHDTSRFRLVTVRTVLDKAIESRPVYPAHAPWRAVPRCHGGEHRPKPPPYPTTATSADPSAPAAPHRWRCVLNQASTRQVVRLALKVRRRLRVRARPPGNG
jgi:hypothetical protein